MKNMHNFFVEFIKIFCISYAPFCMSADDCFLLKACLRMTSQGECTCMLHSRDEAQTEAWSSDVWQPGAPTRTAMRLAASISWKISLDGSNGSSKSHVKEDCFEPASSLGLDKPRRRLKADAVPTVFKKTVAPVLAATGKWLACEGPEGSQSKKVWRGLMRSEKVLGYIIFNA